MQFFGSAAQMVSLYFAGTRRVETFVWNCLAMIILVSCRKTPVHLARLNTKRHRIQSIDWWRVQDVSDIWKTVARDATGKTSPSVTQSGLTKGHRGCAAFQRGGDRDLSWGAMDCHGVPVKRCSEEKERKEREVDNKKTGVPWSVWNGDSNSPPFPTLFGSKVAHCAFSSTCSMLGHWSFHFHRESTYLTHLSGLKSSCLFWATSDLRWCQQMSQLQNDLLDCGFEKAGDVTISFCMPSLAHQHLRKLPYIWGSFFVILDCWTLRTSYSRSLLQFFQFQFSLKLMGYGIRATLRQHQVSSSACLRAFVPSCALRRRSPSLASQAWDLGVLDNIGLLERMGDIGRTYGDHCDVACKARIWHKPRAYWQVVDSWDFDRELPAHTLLQGSKKSTKSTWPTAAACAAPCSENVWKWQL